MIRLRSQKLLSGVSTLAMLAAFGMADPVLAGQTITAAGNPNPPVTNAVSDDFIDIQAGALVQADGSNRSIFNSGTLTSFLSVNNAILQGGVSNTGTIEGDGLSIFNSSFVNGDIANTGTIDGSTTGLLFQDSVLTGNISNSATGLIQGGSTGILIDGSVVLGGISNQGSIGGSSVGLNVVDSTIDGAIENQGSITGTAGIVVNNTVVTDGIQNTGAASVIAGATAGILLTGNTTVLGRITNEGLISASSAGAFGIQAFGGTVDIIGDITNTGSITSFASFGAAVSLNVNTFVGTITNDGLIGGSAFGSATGLALAGGNFVGAIDNTGMISGFAGTSGVGVNFAGGAFIGNLTNTGSIVGNDVGIALSGADFTGTILNDVGGVIAATTTSGIALNVTAGAFTGDIINSGQILAENTSGQAIVIAGTSTFAGNVTNNAGGLISADLTGILIANVTFAGVITNDGSIVSPNGDGILVAPTTSFVGDVVNNGVINGGSPTGDDGIEVTTPLFTGNVTNTGTIEASDAGINIASAAFTGNVTNTATGTIIAGSDGIDINATLLTGDVTNEGSIDASTGIEVENGTLDGSVANSGTITGSLGIDIESTGIVTGDITNAGKITVGSIGIEVNGLVQGTIINTGNIDPATGINVTGSVVGGILNDGGSIIATSVGINVSGATAAHTITQTSGLIQGNNAGVIATALNMNNAFADIFNGDGGVLDGDIIVNATDDFLMAPSDTFVWLRGTTTGTLDQFDLTSGSAVLGAPSTSEDGEGVTVNAASMLVSGGGLLHIDDDTVVNVTGAVTVAASNTLQFHLSYPGAVETNGQIIAGTADITGSTLAAFIDPATLATAAIPTTTTLFYNDVISSGGLTGTFSNVGDLVLSSNPFFEGDIIYDGNNIDIEIRRLAFTDVLVASTQNQLAVGGALEAIYDNAVISADFQNALAAVFAPGTLAEVQARLDELSGAQHAQIQQEISVLTNSINGLVEERLDGALLSQDGARMNAGLAGRQYAQAVAIAASDASGASGHASQGMNRGASGMAVWLRGFGQFAHIDGDVEAPGFDGDSYGAVGGVDFAINTNATVGGAVAYAQTDVDFETPPDNAEVDTWQVNLYGSYGFGRFYADGQASYGWHDVSAVRMIDLPAPAGSVLATSNYDASAWSALAEVGAIWRLGRVNMQPSLGLGYTDSDTDGFTETGPAYVLAVSGADATSLASTLALRASGQWTMGLTRVVPDIKLGWRHEFDDDRQSFTANFVEDLSSGASMTIVSSAIQPDSLVLSTGATFGVTQHFEVFFDVNGQYNADASATNASGGLRFTW